MITLTLIALITRSKTGEKFLFRLFRATPLALRY
jgi:hypothetical protein